MSQPEPATTPLDIADTGVGSVFVPTYPASTPRQRLVREMILQRELGRIGASCFADELDVAILEEFARLEAAGMLRLRDGAVELTRDGLLQVDFLLPTSYDEPFVGGRHTWRRPFRTPRTTP